MGFQCSGFTGWGLSMVRAARHRHPPAGWRRQPRGRWMVSLVNSHTHASSKRWHLWEVHLRVALNSTPGWLLARGGRPALPGIDPPRIHRAQPSSGDNPPLLQLAHTHSHGDHARSTKMAPHDTTLHFARKLRARPVCFPNVEARVRKEGGGGAGGGPGSESCS